MKEKVVSNDSIDVKQDAWKFEDHGVDFDDDLAIKGTKSLDQVYRRCNAN